MSLGITDLSEPYIALLAVRNWNIYQKVGTYKHSLQTLFGRVPSSEDLSWAGLKLVKK